MKKTLFLVAALCTAVAQAETIQYNSTQEVGGNKTLTEDTTFKVAAGATVTRTGNISSDKEGVNLIKEGEGTLKARVNDNGSSNPFRGNVTVNEGTLEIYSGVAGATNIGAGVDTAITVAKGATLQFDGNTGINIPSANEHYNFPNSVALRNSTITTDAYGTSQLSNVKVTTNAIVAVDASERGSVIVNEAALTDTTHATKNVIQGVNLQANDFSVTGDAVIDNATVRAAGTIQQPSMSPEPGAPPIVPSLEVKNGSKVILDNETFKDKLNPSKDWHEGTLSNTTVDKTSYINSGDKDGKLMAKEDMTYIQLKQGNELHIASSGKEGGVANQYFRDSAGNIVTTIEGLQEVEDVYVTDQLSGCALQKDSKLMVTLDDTMLPDPMAFKEKGGSFTFTVVLQGLDSTAVLADQPGFESGTFYDMTGTSPVQLAIGAYKDAPWYQMDTTIHLAAFSGDEASWQGNGPATVFKFTVTGLVIPEPTTATLSLLALAGLAARRRRH